MVLTSTIDAARAFAQLQDDVRHDAELRSALRMQTVVDGRTMEIDIGQLLVEIEPVNGARFVRDLTAQRDADKIAGRDPIVR